MRVHEVPESDWKAYPIRVLYLACMFNFTFFASESVVSLEKIPADEDVAGEAIEAAEQ